MSFEENVKTAAKATVIIRPTNNPRKESLISSGFVVGECKNLCIIMSVGHLFTPHSRPHSGLEIIFHGHEDAVFDATIQVHVPESEILILTVEKRDDMEIKKLIFESADNWELKYFQLLASVSHPCSLPWRAALGIINCPAFLNTTIRKYDSKMVMFDHSLQFGVGSSGAALINEQGHVVGIQSGEIVSKYLAMSGQPVSDALDLKKSETTDLPFQLIAMYISELVYGYQQLHEITTIQCGLKQAVHVKYIDEVLRSLIQKEFTTDVSKISLNDLIEKYISTISSVGYVKRTIHASRTSSSHRYLVRSSRPYLDRPSQPTYSLTSQLTCSDPSSHDFDPPQGINLHDMSSGGLVKDDEITLSEHVHRWVNNGVNKPTEPFYGNTVSNVWGDVKAKSEIVQSWRTAAAAAQKWNNCGDGERSRFDTLQSLHGKSVGDGKGVLEGNSKIVKSWKIAHAAYESGKKEKYSGNKAGWNTVQEKEAGEGDLTGEHFFGSNQDR